MISVILAGGGEGKRMRSRMPKILLPLGGKPVLLRTLEAFHGIRGIGEIILALPSSRISATLKEYGSRLMKLGLIKVVPGGPTRRHVRTGWRLQFAPNCSDCWIETESRSALPMLD